MYLQTGHESEWLRHLQQTERRLCRETNADDHATALTTELTEIQSAHVTYRARLSRIAGWAGRLAAYATAIARWPTKATGRP